MKLQRIQRRALGLWLIALGTLSAQTPPFDSGSTGVDLALEPTASLTIALPPSGILNYTRVSIPRNVEVTFTRNEANTPVYLLASGDVIIEGWINVSGQTGTFLRGGFGGPGGFDGGMPGIAGSQPGDGLGPGGGKGSVVAASVGRGVYSTPSPISPRPTDGGVYGSALLMPLIGGSGGGGSPGIGGGGRGGAILIASSTKIVLAQNGGVYANGAAGNGSGEIWGSGGAIRLVAPEIAGRGRLDVMGPGGQWNAGRIRCDCIERRDFALLFLPSTVVSASDAFMATFVPNLPTLRLVQVAGIDVPLAATTRFTALLPLGTPASQTVVLEASGFGAQVPVEVRHTPSRGGASVSAPVVIDNTAPGAARATIAVTLPANQAVVVEAWTR